MSRKNKIHNNEKIVSVGDLITSITGASALVTKIEDNDIYFEWNNGMRTHMVTEQYIQAFIESGKWTINKIKK